MKNDCIESKEEEDKSNRGDTFLKETLASQAAAEIFFLVSDS